MRRLFNVASGVLAFFVWGFKAEGFLGLRALSGVSNLLQASKGFHLGARGLGLEGFGLGFWGLGLVTRVSRCRVWG